jgi:site-specific DNA-methyltransferase (adenine-specific)
MPVYADDRVTLYHGDCLDVLAALADDSIDSVVTDPPYGLEFMGKDWDAPWRETNAIADARMSGDVIDDPADVGGFQDGAGGNPYSRSRIRYGREGESMRQFQQWCELWAAECLRVLKPGGHLLSFGGTRTWHRLACAVEDAGFEVRDSIAWLYGSGFPKSLDVSKAIDRAAGELKAEGVAFNVAGNAHNDKLGAPPASGYAPPAPVTPGAVKWQGWGTALKPAFEPVVVARKPLAGTVAANVLAHGTGALNIDACRVSTTDKLGGGANKGESNDTRHEGYNRPWRDDPEAQRAKAERSLENTAKAEDLGRWPSNAVLDDDAAAEVDRQSGFTKDGTAVHGNHKPDTGGYGSTIGYIPGAPDAGYGGAGGASRFFPTFRYQSKASTGERPTYFKPSCDCEDSWPTTSRKRATGETPAEESSNTSKSGNATTADQYQAATKFTTSTATNSTTSQGTYSQSHQLNISESTQGVNAATGNGSSRAESAENLSPSAKPTGTSAGKAGRSTAAADRATSQRWSATSRCGNCGAPARSESHATVKPLDLMRWLVRLVTPPGGTVLEPFAGSGTTAEACVHEHRNCIAIEREGDYIPLIVARLTKPMEVGFDFDGAGDG